MTTKLDALGKSRDLVYEAGLLYQRYAPDQSFERDLILHLRFGLVYCDDYVLLLARQVDRHAAPELIEDPFYIFEKPNAHWIHLCVGDMAQLVLLRESSVSIPNLPYVGWNRRNGKPRFYPYKKLCTHAMNIPSILAQSPRSKPPVPISPVEVESRHHLNLPLPQQ